MIGEKTMNARVKRDLRIISDELAALGIANFYEKVVGRAQMASDALEARGVQFKAQEHFPFTRQSNRVVNAISNRILGKTRRRKVTLW